MPMVQYAIGALPKTSPRIRGTQGEFGPLTGRATSQSAEVVVCCRGIRGGVRSRHRSQRWLLSQVLWNHWLLSQRLPQL